jgi:hypothetical protein
MLKPHLDNSAPEKGGEAPSVGIPVNPSKQAQQKATSKAGQLVDYSIDLLNMRVAFKLKLPGLTERGADQEAAAEG